MFDFLNYEFMRTALLAGLLVSVACGVVGTLVVVNRLSFLSGGIAHSAYGGLGLAAFLGWPPFTGAVIFSLASAALMGYVSLEKKERSDTIIGAVWATGMAFGILMLDLTHGYRIDLMSYLFGSILAVSWRGVAAMLVLDIVILAVVAVLYKEFLGMSYDDEFSEVSGVPVKILFYALFLCIALSVVMCIQVVGLILVIALFTMPASIAEMYTKNLKRIMVTASLVSMLFTVSGLVAAYFLNLSAGATIILIAAVSYFASGWISRHRTRQRTAA